MRQPYLTDSLLREVVPRNARCGGKAFFFVCILGLGVFLISVLSNIGVQVRHSEPQEVAINMVSALAQEGWQDLQQEILDDAKRSHEKIDRTYNSLSHHHVDLENMTTGRVAHSVNRDATNVRLPVPRRIGKRIQLSLPGKTRPSSQFATIPKRQIIAASLVEDAAPLLGAASAVAAVYALTQIKTEDAAGGSNYRASTIAVEEDVAKDNAVPKREVTATERKSVEQTVATTEASPNMEEKAAEKEAVEQTVAKTEAAQITQETVANENAGGKAVAKNDATENRETVVASKETEGGSVPKQAHDIAHKGIEDATSENATTKLIAKQTEDAANVKAAEPSTPGNVGGRVVVVGARGRTGRLVFEQLVSAGREVLGLVRSDSKAEALTTEVLNATGRKEFRPGQGIGVSDVLDEASLTRGFSGADTIIVCSSATPKEKKRSIAKLLLLKLVGKRGTPSFKYPKDGEPYLVDYVGAKNIFRAAKDAGVRRVVYIGSMCGTQRENFLNNDGDILVNKRRAEMELIGSGLEYTIIHPAGLIDENGGKRQLTVGCDDELLTTSSVTIPRADVAAVAVACIDAVEAKNRAFDISSLPEGQGSGPSRDLRSLVGSLGTRTCDYSINPPPPTF